MAEPSWLDKLSGQVLRIAGVTKSPTSKIWNFVSGVTAVYNAATGAWDLTVAGGGGSGDVTGLASSVAHRLAAFADTTGKLLEQTTFLAADVLLRTGAVALTGDLDLGTHKAINAGTPTASGDLATKAYVDAIAAGLNPRASVKAVAVANQATMTGTAQTIDGVALNTVGDRVLLTAQSTASQNGPWVIAAGAWTRPTDFLAGTDAAAAHFFVQQGTTYSDTGWVCSSNTGSAVVDTNNLAFVQFSSAGVITAGNGLTKTGNSLAVNTDGSTIAVSGFGIKVANASIGGTQLNAVIAPLATAGSALQQARMNAGGTASEWFSPPTPVDGGLLTNANATKNISDGSQFTLPASTLATSSKTLTLGVSGTPEDQEVIEVIVYSQAFDFILKDGGAIGDNLVTVTAGTKRVLHAQYSTTSGSWRPAGKIRLT